MVNISQLRREERSVEVVVSRGDIVKEARENRTM